MKFIPGELVVITDGEHKGREGKVFLPWDSDAIVCELDASNKIDKPSLAIVRYDELALLMADNETYAERLLPSIDTFI